MILIKQEENSKHSFMPLEFTPSGLVVVLITLITLLVMFSTHSFAQIQTNVPALKDVYANDFYIGCFLSYKYIGFTTDPPVPGQSDVVDPNGGYLVKYHMNSMGSGNNMKAVKTVDLDASAAAYAAATTEKERDSIDIHPVVLFNGNMIAQLNWAKRQGFTFRGHTLIYYDQAPIGFFRSGYTTSGARLTKDKMIQRMDNYIHEIIRLIHEGWPGLLSAIDVVNEAIDYTTDVVRTSGDEWYDTFGDSTYVMTAFQLARQYTIQYGETQIKLYYNDCCTENQKMADGIVRLCTPIFQAGYLDGIGMQEHNFPDTHPTAQGFITIYNKFSPICTEISITELDMALGTRTPTVSELATQANQYGMLFKCFVERSYRSGRGKIVNVTKDGLNDNFTFQTNTASSLWDTLDQCKPAFYAVVNVGINYDSLDLLISQADALRESQYTPASWSSLTVALTSARNAMAQDYSATVSADTALGKAKDNLKAAIDGLVKIVFSPPIITSFTPTSGHIGTSVTITGTNFNPTVANNVVYFGAVKSTVTSATSTSLSVTVPVGATYLPISVTDITTGLTAYSAQPFTITFPSGFVIDNNSFSPKIDFATGPGPYSVCIADIDGDGKPDLIITNEGASGNSVSVFRNTSTSGSIAAGSFATKVDFSAESAPYCLAIADVDGDGKPDLAVTNYVSNTVSIYRNMSTSGRITATSFAAKVDFTTGAQPYGVAFSDIDGDGGPDLVVTNDGSNTVSVFHNTNLSGIITARSFTNKIDFATGERPNAIAIGDVDGDGKPDIIAANFASNTISILRNTSAIGAITSESFAAKVDFTTGPNPRGVAIADIDGDGKPDIAVTNESNNTVSLFRNTCTSGSITSGSFAAKVDFTTGAHPFGIAIADFDGDCKQDIAVTNIDDGTISVFHNININGNITTGSLAPRVDFATGPVSYELAIADIDGDGMPDMVVTNFGNYTVSVLHNTVVTTDVPHSGIIIPTQYDLAQNYPNPFNPCTTIQFSLPRETYVSLSIYNMFGQEIAKLVSQRMNAGIHTTNWNASSFASGVYYYRLQAGTCIKTKKLILLK